jgi:NADP-dependent 3-hydroxy acid dehydrogenase YdfG
MEIFKEHIAVVTGASSGVGRAISLALAAQGATLCLIGRKLETLEATAKSVRSKVSRVLCYQADLTLDQDLQRLIARLQHDFSGIDLLIHSSGAISLGEIEIAPIEDFDWHYRINVRAPYVLTQALLPMLKIRLGQIVFINSSLGLNSRAKVGQYAATKHALKAVADSLRDEVNPAELRVLSVYLGRTAGPMQATLHALEGKVYHPERLLQPEDVAMVVLNALSVPRSAEVTDISIRPLRKPL